MLLTRHNADSGVVEGKHWENAIAPNIFERKCSVLK